MNNGLKSLLGAFCTLALGAYLLYWVFRHPVENAPVQRVIVDNHTTVTVTNNIPPDFSGIALLVLALAVLLYVLARHVLPAMRKRKEEARSGD